jgi:hypothetical protein
MPRCSSYWKPQVRKLSPRASFLAIIPIHQPETWREFLDDARLARTDVVLWNVVPQCVSTTEQNRNACVADIRDALPALQAFIDQLPKLAVVVFCGWSAQRASNYVDLPSRVQVLRTFHPGAMAYNRPAYRADIHATFEKVRRLIAG